MSAAESYVNYLSVANSHRGTVRSDVKEADLLPEITIAEDSDFVKSLFENGIPSALSPTKGFANPLMRKVVALKLQRLKNVEISSILGISKEYVGQMLQHPDATAIMDEVTQDILNHSITTVKNKFKAAANEAFGQTLQLMRASHNDRIRLEASRDILKAAGVLDDKTGDGTTPIDKTSAKIIAETMRELAADITEFRPLGNTAELADIKAEALAAEDVDELTS